MNLLTDAVGQSSITFVELFDEQPISGPIGLESWAVRARAVTSPTAHYLQRRIHRFLWQSDGDVCKREAVAHG
jgi:hypothetical protein